jgi:O-antigen ligase
MSDLVDTHSFRNRLKYAQASIELLKVNPLFGTGLWSFRSGMYEAQARLYEKDPDYFKGHDNPKPRRVHNDYLEILNDGGVVVWTVILILVVGIIRRGWKIREDPLALMILSTLSGSFAAAFFMFPTRLIVPLIMLSIMLGSLERLSRDSGLGRDYNVARRYGRGHKTVSS